MAINKQMFGTSKGQTTLFGGSVPSSPFKADKPHPILPHTSIFQAPGKESPAFGGFNPPVFGGNEVATDSQTPGGRFFVPPPPPSLFGNTPARNTGELQKQDQILSELASLRQKSDRIDKVYDELAGLHQKVDSIVQTLSTEKVYVACKLHFHPLLETNGVALGGPYQSGFTCDNCGVMSPNREERFYQCVACSSKTGTGRFDVCTACIKKQLADQ